MIISLFPKQPNKFNKFHKMSLVIYSKGRKNYVHATQNTWKHRLMDEHITVNFTHRVGSIIVCSNWKQEVPSRDHASQSHPTRFQKSQLGNILEALQVEVLHPTVASWLHLAWNHPGLRSGIWDLNIGQGSSWLKATGDTALSIKTETCSGGKPS